MARKLEAALDERDEALRDVDDLRSALATAVQAKHDLDKAVAAERSAAVAETEARRGATTRGL